MSTIPSRRPYPEQFRATGSGPRCCTPDVAFAHDGDDNRTQMTDGQGTETSTYDALDRLTGVTRAGTTLSFGYD